MKQYKTVSIPTKSHNDLGNELNDYAKDGWSVKERIKTIESEDCVTYYYLLEKNVVTKDFIDKLIEKR